MSYGEPKGVLLSHRNVAANAESLIQVIDASRKDRLLGVLPLFHSFGYTMTLWLPLQVGASVVYYPDPRQAREIGGLCKKNQCTIFLATPTMLRLCLEQCAADDFASLRFLWCGAEKLSPALAKDSASRRKPPRRRPGRSTRRGNGRRARPGCSTMYPRHCRRCTRHRKEAIPPRLEGQRQPRPSRDEGFRAGFLNL